MEFIEQVSGKIWLSAGIVVVFGLALCGFVFRDPRRKHLPPIVRGYWPILNHTLFHMMDDPIDTLIQWRKEYGEIFRTKSGTSTFIWLSSERVTKALIDRRGNIYSSRQPMPMASDLVSGGMRVTFMPYGKEWRTVRSLFQRVYTYRSLHTLQHSNLSSFSHRQWQNLTVPFKNMKHAKSVSTFSTILTTSTCTTGDMRLVSLCRLPMADESQNVK